MKNVRKDLLSVIPSSEERLIVIDTETTGLNINMTDHIIELAAIEVDKGKITGRQFHCYFKPRHDVNKIAFSKHKINMQFYEQNYSNYGPDEKTLLIKFLNFVQDSIIVAHNASFDMRVINKELEFRELNIIENQRFRCSMELYRKYIIHERKNSKLTDCAEYFKIHKNENLFHSAIYDAIMCAKILLNIFQYIFNQNINPSQKTTNKVDQTFEIIKIPPHNKEEVKKITENSKIDQESSFLFIKKEDENFFISFPTMELDRLLADNSNIHSVNIPSNEIKFLLNESTQEDNKTFSSPDLNKIHFDYDTGSDNLYNMNIDFT